MIRRFTRFCGARDEGFTLVELLIALVIMGIAVVALVGALGSLVLSTTNHRGYSVVETVVRNYAESIERWTNYQTTLAQDFNTGDTTAHVADASGFPTSPFFVRIDNETVHVASITGNLLNIDVRHVGDSTSEADHKAPASVLPVFLCASGAAGQYDQQVSGHTSLDAYGSYAPTTYAHPTNATGSITLAEYWNGSAYVPYWSAAGGYGNPAANGCIIYGDSQCDLGGNAGQDVRNGCDPGDIRLTIHVAPVAGDTTLKNVTTDTQIIVRQGSPR